MITMLEVRTKRGSLLSLPLEEASSGYILQGVDGLDPVKATLVSSSFANGDGQEYQSSRRDIRNIVLKLDYAPNWENDETVNSLRKKLYRYLMPKSEVSLRFHQSGGEPDVDIVGVVESFDAPLFEEDPEVSISIVCFDPDFVEPVPMTMAATTVVSSAQELIDYDGTLETGIILVMEVDQPISDFALYHNPPDGSLRILEFMTPLVPGDVLTINTNPGSKGATLLREGTSSSVLYGISPQSNWIELLPGENLIRINSDVHSIPYTITYTNKHGGL